MCLGKKRNFDKKKVSNVTTFGFPYDCVSTMHFKKDYFSKNGRATITGKNNPNQNFGRCSSCGMSIIDADQLNAMYCSAVQSNLNRDTLRSQMARLMAGHSGQKNDVFRHDVLNFLKKVYPNYNFMVNAYNAVSGSDTHAYIGKCAHIFRSYNKNLVVCYSRKTSRFPSAAKQSEIVSTTLATIGNKNCDAKWARDTAWKKATSYGYPIAGIEVVRFGSGLRTASHGPLRFIYYKCHKCSGRRAHKKCNNNHDSSFVIMFG